MRSLVFLLALFSLISCQPARAANAIRVAVVAEGEPNLEALLQAKLAERKNLALLSRTDLPLVESELRSHSGSDRLKLPGLDKLVVVSGTGTARAVRVTDCGSGAVVFEASLPPKLNVQEIAEILALRLPRFLQHVPQPNALKVALLGFRFPESSADNRSLEARLNLACAVALQESRGAVVLERWRMKDLVFENSLRPEAIGAFWNSAAMVQGAISREGDKLTVTLETKSPSDERGQVEKVEGVASDLPALGERLAAAIVRTPPASAGSSQSEAEAYLKETDWLLAHGMYLEAAQAVECAVALDPDNREAEIQRIKVYALGAYPNNLAKRQFYAVHGYAEAIKRENIGRAVTMAGEMSRLVEEYLAKYPAQNEDTIEDPVSLGIRTLLTSLYTLTAAYDFDYHLEEPGRVEALRAVTERNGKTLREKAKYIFRSNVDLYLSNYAGYWCATPEATLAEYRSTLGRDFQSGFPKSWPVALRIPLVMASGHNPPLLDVDAENRRAARPLNVVCRMVAWKPGEEKRVRDLWEAYLNELAASDDLLKQADALYFRWGSQSLDPNREQALGPILDFLEKHPDSLLGPDGRAMAQMLTAPLEHLSYVKNGNLGVRYLDILIKLFEQDVQLPYEMVQRIPQTFGYRRAGDIPTARFEALQDAMARQLAKWDGEKHRYYTDILRNALGALKGISGSAAASEQEGASADGKAVAAPLVVTRLWQSSKYLRGRGYLDGSSGTWHDNWLWFAQRDPVGFWRVNPENFESESISGPGAPDSIRSLNGDSRPLFKDGRILVAGLNDLWSFDLGAKNWQAFGMPAAQYLLYEANGMLWAACGKMAATRGEEQDNQGTSLYRIDTKNRKADLNFSTRRRPAEHPMDTIDIAAPLGVFSGSSGQPIIGLIGKAKKYVHVEDGSPWSAVQPERVWDRVCQADGALLIQRLNAPRNGRTPPLLEAVVSAGPQGHSELLLVDPVVAAIGNPPIKGEPVWKAPQSLNNYPQTGNRYYSAALCADHFFVLTADVSGSTENYTSALELFVFRRGNAEAVRIPLRFELPGGGEGTSSQAARTMKKVLNPWPFWHSFLAGPRGLVISGEWGFWFIPMSDVERALAEAGKKNTGEG